MSDAIDFEARHSRTVQLRKLEREGQLAGRQIFERCSDVLDGLKDRLATLDDGDLEAVLAAGRGFFVELLVLTGAASREHACAMIDEQARAYMGGDPYRGA